MEESVVIAGGGTGGHVFPGLALADAIRARRPGTAVSFVGTARGIETRAVPAAGYELDLVAAMPWARTLGARRFLAPLDAIRATAQARAILRRRRARVVAAMGGYASLPAALAARALRVPLVVHEQNAVPGRANRLASRLTSHVAVTFAGSASFFPHPKRVRVVGNPVRPPIARLDRDALRDEARAHFRLDPSRITVLVAGGSRGSARLTTAARELAGDWAERTDAQILSLAGQEARPDAHEPRLREVAFTDRMDLALAAADVAVARAGAGILELACAGLPCVLVPYPYARDDHQAANARAFERAGAAVVVEDAQAGGERLARALDEIVGHDEARRRMSAASRALARPDAADALAAIVLAAAGWSTEAPA